MVTSANLMPAPFAWIAIPSGKVTLEEGGHIPKGGQTFNVPAFQITKYPITNGQFAKFIEAGGYQEMRWWTKFGWGQRETQKWTEPAFWKIGTVNGEMQPVVGVSWFEAVAFCLWLSDVTSEKIMLPTEQQWQRAAQGDDGRIYPWGNEWNWKLCNTGYTGASLPTPVKHYEGLGDSPYGVVDMAGNVWEWCSSCYEYDTCSIEGDSDRILRGSSCQSGNAQINVRGNRYSGVRDIFGFRLARSL
jgi:formylglycine-generating enzyme required for sulfatase activity